MSQHSETKSTAAGLDLSKWRGAPNLLIGVGAVGAIIGAATDLRQFGFSYLLAYMFFLSLGLGGLGLVILHHLFDASWSVPIRRVNEQLANILKPLGLLWIPIGILACTKKYGMYEWIQETLKGTPDLATKAKLPLFTIPGFYAVSILCIVAWWVLANQLRKHSLEQDKTGSPQCTKILRRYAATGVFFFAFTLTFAVIMWMKALQHEWFSTMYGVYYFAGSMWTTLATVYVIVRILDLQGPLAPYVHEKTYYFLGTLLFAFTVFYAYVTFAQYFIIWNANVPEETFWYVQREQGTWFWVSMVIIFGHFFVPFLSLLRIDAKLNLAVMVPLFVWAWLMHFNDMSFNIMPVLHPGGYHLDWRDIACMALIGGVVSKYFLGQLNSHPILPQKDPRFAESQDIYVAPAGLDAGHETGGGH
jgi:hypothetical protein